MAQGTSAAADLPGESRALMLATWFLALSYILGAAVMMAIELWNAGPSGRFGYWPEFIYLVGLLQIACGAVLPVRRLASWSAAVLAVVMLGAMATHFMGGRPWAAIPSCAYLLLLIWLGWRRREHALGLGA